jgi:glycogen(starch) synthase
MHALVTADTLGGVWTYTRDLVTGLTQRGVHVTLVSFGEIPSPSQSEWLDALPDVDYRATAFKLEWMQECADDLRLAGEYLQDVISDVNPDILHCSQFCFGALSVSIPKVVVAHSDVVSWWVGVHAEEPPDNDWIRFYRRVVYDGLLGADIVVAPSVSMMNEVTRHYLRPRQRVVVHNGRNPGLFNPHVSKDDLAVTVGRVWDKAKNVSLLTQRRHSVPVWIIGQEEHPEDRFRDGTRRDCPSDVRYCGRQSEHQVRQLLSRASMYAATSQYEPFGLAPLEAAFSRCALICNDIPTFRELWGETAIYFRFNDPDDLERKISRLQADSDLRSTYANLAYHRANQRFTAERMVNDYMNLYQSLTLAGAVAA